jgi:hypothetical protein
MNASSKILINNMDQLAVKSLPPELHSKWEEIKKHYDKRETSGVVTLKPGAERATTTGQVELFGGRRFSKSYSNFMNLIAAVKAGLNPIMIGEGYVVISEAKYKELAAK